MTTKAGSKTNPLACGGRGPCCHIGYSHRHCEHCDVVIDTRPASWQWYWQIPTQPVPTQPVPVYGPWYNGTLGAGTPTYNTFGDVTNGGIATADVLTVNALPDPTVAHICEVKY